MSRELWIAYGVTLIAFVCIDMAWLGTVGAAMFRENLGDMMSPTVNLTPAILFYLLFPVGVVYFASFAALEAGRWQVAFVRGAAFGFFAYATYELTNFATLRNWSWRLVLIDIAWGTLLTGAAAAAGVLAAQAASQRA